MNVGTIADGASVTITFPVTVSPNPTSPLSAQGTVTATGLTALRTDDPGVAGNANPTLTPVVENVAPTAVDDAYAVVGGTTLTVAAPGVLTNDTDPDGPPLTAVSPVGPAHGTLTLHPTGAFEYTPDAGYTGPDSFTYRASDSFAQSAPATVTITVSAPPPPPPPPPPPRRATARATAAAAGEPAPTTAAARLVLRPPSRAARRQARRQPRRDQGPRAREPRPAASASVQAPLRVAGARRPGNRDDREPTGRSPSRCRCPPSRSARTSATARRSTACAAAR